MKAHPVRPAPTCQAECRSLLWVDGLEILGMEGEEGTAPCARCLEGLSRSLDKTRPTTPRCPARTQKHRGGKHQLVPTRWDEALDRLAIRFRQLGSSSQRLLWISGSLRPQLSNVIGQRITALLPGSTLLSRVPAEETLARWAGLHIPVSRRISIPELEGADLVILWGHDSARGPALLWRSLRRAQAHGCRVVVVGAANTETAGHADAWLAIHPGTDLALALGLASVCSGRDPSSVPRPGLAAWDLARAAPIVEVEEGTLEAVSRWLQEAQAAVIVAGCEIARHGDPDQMMRGLDLLLEESGAKALLPEPALDPSSGLACPSREGDIRACSSGRLEEQLAARRPEEDIVVIEGSDPLVTWHGVAALREYLGAASFVVVLSPWNCASCGFADLVLPVSSHLELAGACGLRWGGSIRKGTAAIETPRGIQSIVSVFRSLANRLDWPLTWFPGDGEEMLAELAEHPPQRVPLPTPSAKGIPEYRALGEGKVTTPELHRDYPLQIISSAPTRILERVAVSHPASQEIACAVLALEDAEARSISDQSLVRVFNERSQLRALALIDSRQPRGRVSISDSPGPERRGAGELTRAIEGFGTDEVLGGCLVEVVPLSGREEA